MVHLFHERIILDLEKFKELLNGKMVTIGHTFNHEITLEFDSSILEKIGE